jgi:hypothetical protein
VLIKELQPGFPAAHQPQLVPGLKLKAVQGASIDECSFGEALELVRNPERPLTLCALSHSQRGPSLARHTHYTFRQSM